MAGATVAPTGGGGSGGVGWERETGWGARMTLLSSRGKGLQRLRERGGHRARREASVPLPWLVLLHGHRPC